MYAVRNQNNRYLFSAAAQTIAYAFPVSILIHNSRFYVDITNQVFKFILKLAVMMFHYPLHVSQDAYSLRCYLHYMQKAEPLLQSRGSAQDISQNRLRFDHVVCFPLKSLTTNIVIKNAKRHETNYLGMLKQFLKAKSVD